MRPRRFCVVEDCSERVHGHGFCSMHYKRWRKTGSPHKPSRPICAAEGCIEEAAPGRKGWCRKHYGRWRRTGDPNSKTASDWDDDTRFWSNVDKSGPVPDASPELGACWVWTGSMDDSGYGLFRYSDGGKSKKTRAHRWLLGRLRGRPLTRDVVGAEDGCHRCDNPSCCNPTHLYVGTRKQNIADAVSRKRLRQQRVTHCPQGHEYVYNPSGNHRRCKQCEQAQQHLSRTVNRTTCKNGHPLDGDNLLLCKNGTRKCRICDASRQEASRTARRRSREG